MRCPVDEATLVMSERNGIEIDYCPTCRGVWLDRGELDKILDRSVQLDQPRQAPAPAQPQQPQYDNYRAPQQQGYPPQQQGYYKKKRKESWLSEIFD
jgi:Zn-finger nucleic acid-binding protein